MAGAERTGEDPGVSSITRLRCECFRVPSLEDGDKILNGSDTSEKESYKSRIIRSLAHNRPLISIFE